MNSTFVSKRKSKRMRGWPSGYRAPKGLRPRVAHLHETRFAVSVGTALFDLASIFLLAASVAYAYEVAPLFLSLPAVLIAQVFIARQQRGLECLIHEASHGNWHRARPRLNDAAANLLAAYPVASSVSTFRASHTPHHENFGTAADPDYARYMELDLDRLDRSSVTSYVSGMLARMPKYQASWWRSIGTNRKVLARSLAWHAVFILTPLGVAFGPAKALMLWLAFWCVPMFTWLTAIRFIGEAGEHHFTGTATVVDATITNSGMIHRWLIHPHADFCHTAHHLYRGVPHHRLEALHQMLFEEDSVYASLLRERKRVLDDPYANTISRPPDAGVCDIKNTSGVNV